MNGPDETREVLTAGYVTDLDPDEVREWLAGSVDPGPGPVDDPARIAERIRDLRIAAESPYVPLDTDDRQES